MENVAWIVFGLNYSCTNVLLSPAKNILTVYTFMFLFVSVLTEENRHSNMFVKLNLIII